MDRNIEALESSQLVTSVLGTLSGGTKVLQDLPGKSGKAFDALDDNAIALDEADELSGALCGNFEGDDADIEAQLDADLGRDASEGLSVSEPPPDLGLPSVCTEPLVGRKELMALSQEEPVLPEM